MEQIFGNKEIFAIEIKIVDKIEKSNLRIWINENPLGYFKRNGELIYSIRNLKKLIFNRHGLYENSFDKMSSDEMFKWILGNELLNNSTLESRAEFKRRHKYVVFWGDQLDEFSTICYFKNAIFYWIIYDVKKKKALSFKSKEEDVVPVLEEYISWYENSYGKVKVDYFNLLNKN